jgi:hypothetical protein
MSKQGQYIIVQLLTRTDFSDNALLDFKEEKGTTLTTNEYSTYLRSNKIESNNSRKLVNFFIEYDNGALMPEKCDAYEPIRDNFDKDDIAGPLKWLSQPGSALFLKRTKGIKYQGRIENHRFAPLWQDGKILPPKVAEPPFLGEINLYLEIGLLRKKKSDYLFDLLLQMARVINASYGFVALEAEYESEQIKISKLNKDSCLPGIFWINYFGDEYTTFFGAEKLRQIASTSSKFNLEDDFIFSVSEDPQDPLVDNQRRDIITSLGEANFN